MTIWEQQGGREVPVRCHVLLILSGALTKRRTSCHSPSSFDILTTSESRLGFVHNEDWWPVDEPHSGSKTKNTVTALQGYVGARADQFSSLEPEALQKRCRLGN